MDQNSLSVPVEEYGDVTFQMVPFEGMEEVRVGFRISGDGNDEHWLNKYAACLTSTGEDYILRNATECPYGKMCHAELMMQIQKDVWTRHSIYLGTYDPDTKKIAPGKVHIKLVDDAEALEKFDHGESKKYEILPLYVNREDQLNAMKFLVAQNEAPFNKNAYYYNLIPGFNFGTKRYDYDMNKTQRSWYCTELVVCALQSMVSNPRTRNNQLWGNKIWDMKANHSSPNSLYRTLKNTREVRNAFFRIGNKSSVLL